MKGNCKLMAKNNKVKKVEKPKLISGIFEEELLSIIDERINTNSNDNEKSDLKEIAKILLPDIDMLISTKVKLHMKLLGEYVIKQSQ